MSVAESGVGVWSAWSNELRWLHGKVTPKDSNRSGRWLEVELKARLKKEWT